MPGRPVTPPATRFFSMVEFDDRTYNGTRCLVWTGCKNNRGYGRFSLTTSKPQKWVLAHRWLYEHWVGPIPDGLTIDHLCFQRHCVNPAHLEPVTVAENNRRAEQNTAERPPIVTVSTRGPRTHCKRGHPWNEENMARRGDGNGFECRPCRSQTGRRRRQGGSVIGDGA